VSDASPFDTAAENNEAKARPEPRPAANSAESQAVTFDTPAPAAPTATAVMEAPPKVGGWRPPKRGTASTDFFESSKADAAPLEVDYIVAARRAQAAQAAPTAQTAPSAPAAASAPPTPPPPPAPTAPPLAAAHRPVSSYFYWLLLLLFIPLAWVVTHRPSGADRTVKEQLYRTIAAHPEAKSAVEALPPNASLDDIFDAVITALPEHKLDGAYLARDTVDHWTFASMSVGGFLLVVILLFPVGDAKWQHMISIGVFTGTVGICLLLAFQRAALQARFVAGGGWLGILSDLLWLVGQSYRMALGSNNGFAVSFLGFTAGVGFCEEVCKALPMLWQARRPGGFLRWRSAMLWGLVSGIGFGVSEGITYCADSYNGIASADAYLVRFISCVGLHAIWSAAVGVTLFRHQHLLRQAVSLGQWFVRVAQVVIVPMVLHGLYDTLLKQHFDHYALGIALLSFAWLAYQIERAERSFLLPSPLAREGSGVTGQPA
jgi:RsiW-degrading membrane proteinase PrsW (M82 family)